MSERTPEKTEDISSSLQLSGKRKDEHDRLLEEQKLLDGKKQRNATDEPIYDVLEEGDTRTFVFDVDRTAFTNEKGEYNEEEEESFIKNSTKYELNRETIRLCTTLKDPVINGLGKNNEVIPSTVSEQDAKVIFRFCGQLIEDLKTREICISDENPDWESFKDDPLVKLAENIDLTDEAWIWYSNFVSTVPDEYVTVEPEYLYPSETETRATPNQRYNTFLFGLMETADHLGCYAIVKVLAKKFASMIEGKESEDIRIMFNAPDDLSDEDKARIKAECDF